MGEEEGKEKLSSSWHARRHFIVLAALGGTVAATAVVITVSVILRPAHVEFAVARATQNTIATVEGNNDEGMYLNLTVTARTTSGQRRAMVKYRKVFVDLVAKSRQNMKEQTFRAPLQTPLPGGGEYVPAGAGTPAASINASLLLVGDSLNSNVSLLAVQVRTGNAAVNVVVTAQVCFKIGVVDTGVYDIAVRCPHVSFLSVNQTAAPPVICTG